MPELKKRVREFMSELNEWALQNNSPEQIYAMYLVVFLFQLLARRNSGGLKIFFWLAVDDRYGSSRW